jgi:uncharacterized membrane protein YcjF (UPF0283 family)
METTLAEALVQAEVRRRKRAFSLCMAVCGVLFGAMFAWNLERWFSSGKRQALAGVVGSGLGVVMVLACVLCAVCGAKFDEGVDGDALVARRQANGICV